MMQLPTKTRIHFKFIDLRALEASLLGAKSKG